MNIAKHKNKRVMVSTFILLVLGLIMALGPAQMALADGTPAVPEQFYGTVTNNGSQVGSGNTVSAQVGGTTVASTSTDAQGTYGVSSAFYVSASPGSTIQFYVNGVVVSQTAPFRTGSIIEVDLTVVGAGGQSTTPITALGIVTSTLANATVGSAYSATLIANGGTSPYTWLTSGSLPAGLTLAANSGVISGTPTATETASFTAQVSDSASLTSSRSFSIEVGATTTTTTTTPITQAMTISTSVLGQASSFDVSSAGVLATLTTLSSAAGNVQLSLNADTTVNIEGQSLTVTAEAAPPAPPSDARLVSAYDITPNDSTFSPDIALTLRYDAASLPQDVSESNLYIAFWNGSSWSELPSTVDTQDESVSAQVSHFTVFAILGGIGSASPATPAPSTPATPPPAGFAVSALDISPASVKAGEQVTVITAVANNSTSQGSYNAVLKINGTSEAQQEVTLNPNETKVVTFNVSKDTAGSYQVAIADKSGSFTVTTSQTGSTSKGGLSWLGIAGIVLGAIVVIAIVAVRIRSMARR